MRPLPKDIAIACAHSLQLRTSRNACRDLSLIFRIKTLRGVAADFEEYGRVSGNTQGLPRECQYLSHLLGGVAATANRVLAEKSVLNGRHQSSGISVSVLEVHHNSQTHLDSEPLRQIS
jgi:hypothetical protein